MQAEYVVDLTAHKGGWSLLRVESVSKTGKTVQLVDDYLNKGERYKGTFDENRNTVTIKGGIVLGGPHFVEVPETYLHTFPSYENEEKIPMSRGDTYVIERASIPLHAKVKGKGLYRGYVLSSQGRVRDKKYSPSLSFLRSVHRDFMDHRAAAEGEGHQD